MTKTFARTIQFGKENLAWEKGCCGAMATGQGSAMLPSVSASLNVMEEFALMDLTWCAQLVTIGNLVNIFILCPLH